MIPDKTLTYLLSFMLRQPVHSSWIGYTADKNRFPDYRIVIIPSRFFTPDWFGKPVSRPALPLPELDGVPVLFGTAEMHKQGSTLVLHADLVAGAFFLLSRYEETVCAQRDSHGRFPGKESLLYRQGCIDRPVVDEYGRLLRRLLRESGVGIAEPEPEFSDIYLTHDVDRIAQYRNFRGFCGGVLRTLLPPYKGKQERLRQVLASAFGKIDNDPLYTFPWLFGQDAQLPSAKVVLFFKADKSDSPEDRPCYGLESKDMQYLLDLCRVHRVSMGLHLSYFAAANPKFVKIERKRLEKRLNFGVTANRNHYLRSLEPESLSVLAAAGITDDFTMGYADVAGFRLGTCHAVQWINPCTKELTDLLLHPLTLMDGTLSTPQYMGLSYAQAFDYARRLVGNVRQHGGELVLLWHNDSVSYLAGGYHKQLYSNLIQYIRHETSVTDN